MANTQHGMLVAFGEFLGQHGLIERLMQVPIGQKTRTFTPQTKLVEFLAGIMSGIEHLQDFNDGPRPLVKDSVVARAWGQPSFAHYSGVSRTLDACDEQTVAAVEQAINEFSRPFLATAIDDLLHRGAPLIYDFDLTGQAVSPTSTTYPEVAFGWMNDSVKLGYQLARVCLSPQGRDQVWLAGFHHPGDTVSAACLKELVEAAEAQTGVRPRRRPELVQQRIETQRESIARTRRLLNQQQSKLIHLQQTQRTLHGKVYHAEQVRKGPISRPKAAVLKKQLAGWRKRLPRLETQLADGQQVVSKHQHQLLEQETKLTALLAWQTQLETANRTNPNPPPYVEARMDAGFATGANLTWLLEMGYCPNTKAPNGQTAPALRARLPPHRRWLKVGDNAEMIGWGEYYLHGCPYPLTAALERFKVGREYKYAVLLHYRDDGLCPTLPVWFQHYNQRQTIEAGNKEMKGTFFVQHLMSRSPAGIRLQVLFTGLAANVVRWCVPWLKNCAAETTPKLSRTLNSPKHLVRVAANSAALVQQTTYGTALQFVPESSLPGVTLFLKGVPAFQPTLGFHQPYKIASG
jgi:hypothetical protein